MCSVTLSPSFTLEAAAWKVVSNIMSGSTRITGMMSPAERRTTSPGTTWSMGMERVSPSRTTSTWLEIIDCRAAAALHERSPCTNETRPDSPTRASTMTTVVTSPLWERRTSVTKVMAATSSKTRLKGLTKACPSR